VLWLVTVLLCGDLWAALTFGVLPEIVGLTGITFLFGLLCIWWLPNWNGLGQTLWATSILTTVLYIAYSFAVSTFTPLNPLAFLVALGLTLVEAGRLVG
jgi:hypothetical protein